MDKIFQESECAGRKSRMDNIRLMLQMRVVNGSGKSQNPVVQRLRKCNSPGLQSEKSTVT